MTNVPDSSMDPNLDLFVKAAMRKKTIDLVVLDVHKLTSLADVFIICSGRSNRQVSAIAEHIQLDLKKQGITPLSVEGKKEGHWVVLDYGHVIIHVFFEPVREFYDLESLWIDAEPIKTKSLINTREERI
ncbi:MAG: ribosome silencing factor [Deltaproteobacteria bacterium]|jgi:ribosome-associated protein|nr:ribosome silencing factor [Deltaproteobacteria bacterium]MBW2573091.1 ribosome silencing factor [Deltaproteobacteria bacterium]MBW2668969.1 ribosome silencing factor [Deltaproteobacteria bacterium]MBW2710716.1 ribosome silencing factor [Deltaproteobacteria bacterium]NOQ20647.1 ribosome silencing factor [Desulfobacterales bacterium]